MYDSATANSFVFRLLLSQKTALVKLLNKGDLPSRLGVQNKKFRNMD